MAYAVGHVSGCHLNTAVSIGLWAGGRFKSSELVPYILAQVLGAIVGAACFYAIASGKAGFDVHAGFASNGFGDLVPNTDPFDQHSGHQYFGESRAQHGSSTIVGGWALDQLWLFWVAPLIGAVLGGAVYRWMAARSLGRRKFLGKCQRANA
jgi:aquaporin Z